jgi:hypothetical protein
MTSKFTSLFPAGQNKAGYSGFADWHNKNFFLDLRTFWCIYKEQGQESIMKPLAVSQCPPPALSNPEFYEMQPPCVSQHSLVRTNSVLVSVAMVAGGRKEFRISGGDGIDYQR